MENAIRPPLEFAKEKTEKEDKILLIQVVVSGSLDILRKKFLRDHYPPKFSQV